MIKVAKKVLFITGDFWSMGNRQGMPSVFNFAQYLDARTDLTVFTTESQLYRDDFKTKKIKSINAYRSRSPNRYFSYLLSTLSYIWLNARFFIAGLSGEWDLIYCAGATFAPAAKLLSIIKHSTYICRLYGTFLHRYLQSPLGLISHYVELIAYKSNADLYVITDDGTKGDEVARAMRIPRRKLLFIRNGVELVDSPDLSRGKMAELYCLPEKPLWVLAVSRLVRWKRVDRIVRAWSDDILSNAVLIIVGDGEERAMLEALASGKNIHFLGSVSQASVHALMKMSDLFVTMYDISNLGNPLLEALMSGLPVLALDTGDTGTVLLDRVNGLLIKNDTEETIMRDLVENLNLLLVDKELREKLSGAAKNFAMQNILSIDKRLSVEFDKIMDVHQVLIRKRKEKLSCA